jgi:hypothetical protein
MNHSSIRYRDFYDVPRIFLVLFEGQQFLFDCPFDGEVEDYSESYRVYAMPLLADADLKGSWERLPQLAIGFLGIVPVNQVQFDPTKRAAIDAAIIGELLHAKEVTVAIA